MSDPYVVIDVETTGLKAHEEAMLEIAMCIADPVTLLVHDHFSSVIAPIPLRADELRAECIPLIQEMHDASGLWKDLAEIQSNEYFSLSNVSMRAVDWLTQMMAKYNFVRPPMMGNSVQLDREFVEVHMPTLFELFHYRNIDVSTLKEVCTRRNPTIFAGSPKEQGDGGSQPHRALYDCIDTLGEYSYYANFLLVEPEVTA